MNDSLDRPVLVFDGDCAFCRAWVEYWQRLTGERVLYTPYQEIDSRFPNLPRRDFASAVTLFLPSGEVRSGAHAVFSLLALVPGKSWMLWLYAHIPGFAWIAEMVYRVVARHRSFCFWATRVLWGVPIEVESFGIASWLFLRTLGAVYLFAFASFAVQAAGLIGSRGISPVGEFLRSVREYYGGGYWQVPTLFWLNAGDRMIRAVGVAGICLSVLLLLGVRWRILRVALVRALSFAGNSGPGIYGVPVGCAAARGRLSGDSVGLVAGCDLALSLAAVPFDVSFWRGEIGQRRSVVAALHGAAGAL